MADINSKNDLVELEKYKRAAQRFVVRAKRLILPLPKKLKIAQEYLGDLTNDEFVGAFSELRQHVSTMYDDILNAPFDWGYPDFDTSDSYRNRVNDVLFAFINNGVYNNGVLTVDAKEFFKSTAVKRHRKTELMIKGFNQFGFVIDGYNKKSTEFRVKHLDNQNIIYVLYTLISSYKDKRNKWTHLDTARNGYSYRFVEDLAEQEYEMAFHTLMDYATPELVDIQKWLYAEARKCGYKIDTKETMEKGMLLYKKGAKRFLLVGFGYEKIKIVLFRKLYFGKYLIRTKNKLCN